MSTEINQILSTNIRQALYAANSPTQANPFATIADIGGGGTNWSLTGNIGTTAGIDFVGTIDNQPLVFKVNSVEVGRFTAGGTLNLGVGSSQPSRIIFNNATNNNTVIIQTALTAPSSYTLLLPIAQGGASTFLQNDGFGVLSWASAGSGWELTGNSGTTVGTNFIGTTDDISLMFKINNVSSGLITRVANNTFFGYNSGASIVGGVENTGNGYSALGALTSGNDNVAMGTLALAALTSGASNTGIGYGALRSLTGANSNNVALGFEAGFFCTGGSNTFIGTASGFGSGTCNFNTAIGFNSLNQVNTGASNVAIGYYAGYYETTSNNFYVNNQDRTNTAGDQANSLIYGIFAAAAVNQKLYLNAGTINVLSLPTGNGGLASGDLYVDTAANILANSDKIVARKA